MMMITQAVILAGGEGTRLRPVTYEIPKPLIPVHGKAILTWLVEWFVAYGVEEIHVIIAPKWKQVFEKWETEQNNIKIHLWEESEPMGTMGMIAHHLHKKFTQPFFLTNGDELKSLQLAALERAHHASRAFVTIGLVRVPNPSDYGVAEMNGSLISHFHEKPQHPPTNLISSGLYLIDPIAFKQVDGSKKFLMFEKDLFPHLAQHGQLGGCALEGQWYDCGTLERWEKAIKEWKDGLG